MYKNSPIQLCQIIRFKYDVDILSISSIISTSDKNKKSSITNLKQPTPFESEIVNVDAQHFTVKMEPIVFQA